jgi:arylsulfatase A-like enzyme
MIVICSDNGWQMPRGLANLYDFGTRIPMIVLMPNYIKGNRVVDDFVSLSDLAPTFLELAGLPIPDEMTFKSLVNVLYSEKNGLIEPERDFIVSARERHAYVRKGGAGFGGRSIRTNDYLLIRNYESENWPAGDPPLFGDVDAHMLHYPSPTKLYILQHRNRPDIQELFKIAFDKRPEIELYDLRDDPFQMNNVAGIEMYSEIQVKLQKRLEDYLVKTRDPRVTGGEMKWIGAKYYAPRDFHPVPNKMARDSLGLKNRYSYLDE